MTPTGIGPQELLLVLLNFILVLAALAVPAAMLGLLIAIYRKVTRLEQSLGREPPGEAAGKPTRPGG